MDKLEKAVLGAILVRITPFRNRSRPSEEKRAAWMCLPMCLHTCLVGGTDLLNLKIRGLRKRQANHDHPIHGQCKNGVDAAQIGPTVKWYLDSIYRTSFLSHKDVALL